MASAPQVGDLAPDFALEGTDGSFRLSEHRGQRVVLLFYPGDETAVCTKQFCSYRDRADDMSALDAVVVGISHQDVDSHEAFTAHHGLTVVTRNVREFVEAGVAVIDPWAGPRMKA